MPGGSAGPDMVSKVGVMACTVIYPIGMRVVLASFILSDAGQPVFEIQHQTLHHHEVHLPHHHPGEESGARSGKQCSFEGYPAEQSVAYDTNSRTKCHTHLVLGNRCIAFSPKNVVDIAVLPGGKCGFVNPAVSEQKVENIHFAAK